MGMLKKYVIVIIIITLNFAFFFIGMIASTKNKQEKEDRKIQIAGVWKAQNIEVGTSKKIGDFYYFIFDKNGNVYTIDGEEVKYGNYSDTENIGEFAIQIDNGSISNCIYDKYNIKCELYGDIERIK